MLLNKEVIIKRIDEAVSEVYYKIEYDCNSELLKQVQDQIKKEFIDIVKDYINNDWRI